MVRIIFLHPDLGIGGAERAVIDAALALTARGHLVRMVTAHHDPNHCFEETRDGRVRVTVAGDWLPRSFLGLFRALFAYLRMIYVALYLVFFSGLQYDLVFCDQISACIPVLRLKRGFKVLFYCHYPDLLLSTRSNFLKRLYRAPIDWLEERTTGMADIVLVNSEFTASVFHDTFRSLRSVNTEVVYPIPNILDVSGDTGNDACDDLVPSETRFLFVSINRYERKKNLPLAITALAKLRERRGGQLEGVQLVVAGGYDERVDENRQHHLELCALTDRLDLEGHVTFLRSITSDTKRRLLARCTALIYTPDREHFGIVPVEAMYGARPVIAVNSGGPCETVVDGVTGFLCDSKSDSFAAAMEQFIVDESLSKKLGEAGRKRVREHFSFESFTNRLDEIVKRMF